MWTDSVRVCGLSFDLKSVMICSEEGASHKRGILDSVSECVCEEYVVYPGGSMVIVAVVGKSWNCLDVGMNKAEGVNQVILTEELNEEFSCCSAVIQM